MRTYESVKQSVFATATVPDGYFGKRETVGLAIVDNHVMCVSDHGYYRSGLEASNPEEALYYLKNHALHYRNYEVKLI